ncbi:MAG: efflux transporter outer membrane subunit [Rudaea sp.]|uniref:efflux transporter outer membrane subunit n=1 Tax=Rudaea sp. TaxID=2136325 RepID=UPI0039E6C5BC
MNDALKKTVLLSFAASLCACAAGPDYKRPDVPGASTYANDAYKEQAGWKPAQPGDAIARGAWWEIFGDPVLNDLEQQVEAANQSLKQAEAQYRQTAALVSSARASFWPIVSASLSATRSASYATSSGGNSGATISKSYQLPIAATWEPDLWGSVRREVEGDIASAQASASTLANTRLSLQATLAQTYFQLRIVDEQKRLLDDTVAAYSKALQLTENQYKVGVAARADVVQAQTQLKSAQAQAIDLGVARAQYEHALAVLVGKTPAEFSLAPAKTFAIAPPGIPLDLPSHLLERRPDVAVAERQAAEANAQVGVATAAWFPSLTLSASGGYSNSVWSQLLDAPSRYWSIGPKIAETLFDGGARRAQTAQARAAWDAAVANYRQVSLAAFQNVEDQIAALRILEQEAQAQDEAVRLSEQSLKITTNQYRAGIVSYLNVITAQNTAYGNERSAITLLGTRLNDSVGLVKALGGGWQAKDLPEAGAINLHSQAPAPEASAKESP